MVYLLGQVFVRLVGGCKCCKDFFKKILCNYDVIYNNVGIFYFFCFKGGEVVFNNMKKVLGNMGIEFKDEKYWELVNNLLIDGNNFYNNVIFYLSEKERMFKKIFKRCYCFILRRNIVLFYFQFGNQLIIVRNFVIMDEKCWLLLLNLL